jgi:hypothetical protein
VGADDEPAQADAGRAQQTPEARQAQLRIGPEAARHGDVGLLGLQLFHHASDEGGIVLSVSVHHAQDVAARDIPTGDAGRGEAAHALALQDADAGIPADQRAHHCRRPIVG